MNEEQKSQLYGMFLNEHTRLHNKINEIKGSTIDLDIEQKKEIVRLENQQKEIMKKINILLSR